MKLNAKEFSILLVISLGLFSCGTVISTQEKVAIDSTGDTVTTEASRFEISTKEGVSSDFYALADIYRFREIKFISENEGYFKSAIAGLDSVHFMSRINELGSSFIFSGKNFKSVYSVELPIDGDGLLAVLKVSKSLELALQNTYVSKQNISLNNENTPISQGITEKSSVTYALPRLAQLLAMDEAADFKANLSIAGPYVELSGQPSYETCKANLENEANNQCGTRGYKQYYLYIRNNAENQMEFEGYLRFACK